MHRLSTNLNRRKRKPYGDEIVLNALFMRHSSKAIEQKRCLGYVTGAAIRVCGVMASASGFYPVRLGFESLQTHQFQCRCLLMARNVSRLLTNGGSIPLTGTNFALVVQRTEYDATNVMMGVRFPPRVPILSL